MRFSVIVPTVRPTTLAAAITAVRAQTVTDWELIVVGQGDDRPLRAAVCEAADDDERVRFEHLDRFGLSVARNAGIAASRGELIAFTDDDCEARPDWLEVLAEAFDDPAVGLVGGTLLAPPPERRLSTCPEMIANELVYDPIAAQRTAPRGWGLVGGNFAVRRSVTGSVGGFDEALGAGSEFAAAEETDYMLRLELAGIKMATTPRSVVDHTSGHRYGWRAIYDHKRNYARGNGALAAKLSLLGDERGDEWMAHNRAELERRLRPRQLHRLPAAVLRFAHFRRAYAECRGGYQVVPADDPVRAVLERVTT